MYEGESIERTRDRTIKLLNRHLDFTPSTLDLRDLMPHIEAANEMHNSYVKKGEYLSAWSIPDPAWEAILRFLKFECGIIQTENEFYRLYGSDEGTLTIALLHRQSKMYRP
jgi:hypothetical protein